MKLCSACLLGIKCRYDGRTNLEKASPKLLDLYGHGELIPICPEQMGRLPIPRSGARILSGDGNSVLDKNSRILTDGGNDVTKQYLRGAYETLRVAQDLNIKEVILKQKSPSCGCGYTQGGLVQRTLVEGDGVTTALLKRNGIKVISEENL
ncbi:hypothetical protein A3K64_01735 [Candidatus Micrarchaeota archaeon RBG_16_36_9]|nr:MAG: hypothetical protein A3K64_01735 [Candidatus Micrarchaeota archaeon RBG_16_36_9]